MRTVRGRPLLASAPMQDCLSILITWHLVDSLLCCWKPLMVLEAKLVIASFHF